MKLFLALESVYLIRFCVIVFPCVCINVARWGLKESKILFLSASFFL